MQNDGIVNYKQIKTQNTCIYISLTTVKHITNQDGYVIGLTIMATWSIADMHNEVNFSLPSSIFIKRHYFPGRKINY